jgi:drug/metabolite transporter (DMT)-like permease
VPIILSLASAILYGLADFAGGHASRRNSVFAVMVISQAIGIAVALVAAPLVGPNSPGLADMAWGAAAGVSGCLGVVTLYRGLARHTAAIVSPLSALVGAILPVAFGAALGERPTALSLVGAALCLPAIILLAYEKGESADRAKLRASFLYGTIAGLGFSGFFIAASRTAPASGLWPLLSARAASLAIVATIALAGRKGLAIAKADRPVAVFAGAADMLANILFLVATRGELLMLVTLIVSLYPAPTVLLARIFHGQRISLPRALGIALALAGVALIGIK